MRRTDPALAQVWYSATAAEAVDSVAAAAALDFLLAAAASMERLPSTSDPQLLPARWKLRARPLASPQSSQHKTGGRPWASARQLAC